jgi:hypothetical protein
MTSLRATVIEVRCASKRPVLGTPRWRRQLFTAEDHAVFELEAASLFDLTGA